jgi:excisionase family DNA binding protein
MHMNESNVKPLYNEKESNMKEFYTVNEFAKIMNVHPSTIRRALKRKQLISMKFGSDARNTHRIPHSEFDRCMMKDLKEHVRREIEQEMNIVNLTRDI